MQRAGNRSQDGRLLCSRKPIITCTSFSRLTGFIITRRRWWWWHARFPYIRNPGFPKTSKKHLNRQWNQQAGAKTTSGLRTSNRRRAPSSPHAGPRVHAHGQPGGVTYERRMLPPLVSVAALPNLRSGAVKPARAGEKAPSRPAIERRLQKARARRQHEAPQNGAPAPRGHAGRLRRHRRPRDEVDQVGPPPTSCFRVASRSPDWSAVRT